jgi:uncharacterized protein (DUF2141 family)
MILNSVFIMAALSVIATIAQAQFRLEIEIAGFRNDNGAVMLQLLDSVQQVVAEKMDSIRGGKCTIAIGDLKAGKYACRYFHDENLSGKMETGRFGIPTEGYGFSNNASGMFGPLPFKKWIFEVKADKKINLKPVY